MYTIIGGIHAGIIVLLYLIVLIIEMVYWIYFFVTDQKYSDRICKKLFADGEEMCLALFVAIVVGLTVGLLWPLVDIFIIGMGIVFGLRYLVRKNKSSKITKRQIKKEIKKEKKMETNYEKTLTLKKEYEDLQLQLEDIKGKMLVVKQKAKDELNWILNDKIDD